MDELEMERRVTEVEQRSKSNTHQIEDIKKRQDNLDSLITSVAELATEQGHIKEDVGEIKADLKGLTSKPGKRWDSMVDKIWLTVVASLVGYLLAKLLGG